jgi:hypothetical protein
MDRGDVFHGYFGEPILDYLQLPGCDIELALETLGNCPICGEGGFKFGGSVDAYHAASETLIDFKFSTHCGDAAYLESNYIPQLAAYRNLLELHNKPVSKVLLIAVHPETFVAIHYDWTDLTAWKQEYETLIIDHHLSKVHHRPCYRPNPFCHFCDRTECSAKKRKGTARLEKVVLDARIAEEKANMVHAVSGCENPPKDYADLGLDVEATRV